MVVLFAFAVANKINILQRETISAHEETISIQKEAAATLELKVEDRTRELAFALDEVENINEKLTQSSEELADAYEQLREIDTLKSNFFANVSHEIRTPLTLILTPIDALLEGNYHGRPDRGFFETLRLNGYRLLELINNLLDFSRLDAGRMAMKVHKTDMEKLLRDHVAALQSVCDLKGVRLAVESAGEPPQVCIDPEKIDKVCANILSNALKFTDKGGSITVRVGNDDHNCVIVFGDTGIGIPPDKIGSIFERFSQADSASSRKYGGTGIGLALARELLSLHGGSITVESRHVDDHPRDHGTVFTVSIPMGMAHLEGKPGVEICDEAMTREAALYPALSIMEESPAGFEPADARSNLTTDTDPVIMVVEDNPDMHRLLTVILGGKYRIVRAGDGNEAIDILRSMEDPPDLVLADVMMPGMDGYELTRIIRSDARFEGVPIILLTARADPAMRIEGFETGATDYITKPFNARELEARISAQLELKQLRDRLVLANRQLYKRLEKSMKACGGAVTAEVEVKIRHVTDFINDNYTEDISREGLAAAVDMSPDHLSRMFNKIQGMRMDEYINKLRAEEAARCLKETDKSITFIAMNTGFESLRHFNRVFNKIHGMSPSEFRSQNN